MSSRFWLPTLRVARRGPPTSGRSPRNGPSTPAIRRSARAHPLSPLIPGLRPCLKRLDERRAVLVAEDELAAPTRPVDLSDLVPVQVQAGPRLHAGHAGNREPPDLAGVG